MASPKEPRKRSRRAKTTRKNPENASRLKALWATPEFREKMKERDTKRLAAAKQHPEKFWRTGVPDGMRKRDAMPLWERARELADRFIRIMKDQGELPDEEVELITGDEGQTEIVKVPATDAGKAERALKEAFVLAVGPSEQKIKIQAINTVLNFTKSKPESKVKLTTKPEDFLDELDD